MIETNGLIERSKTAGRSRPNRPRARTCRVEWPRVPRACQDAHSARKTTVDGIGDLLANGLARQDVRDVCV